MRLRRLRSTDRLPLLDLLRGTQHFTAGEIAVADELIQDAVADPVGHGYWGLVAADDADRPLGYAIYGPTPMTDACWDLYWIAIHVERRGNGVGKKLLQEVEADVRDNGGRIIRIETSSKEGYGDTRKFYEALDYHVVGQIPNFYREGDDLVLLSKELPAVAAADRVPLEAPIPELRVVHQ